MMTFNTPALIVGKGIQGENIAFLAEPEENYKKDEIFGYFSPTCTSLQVIPLAGFVSASDRNFVINHMMDMIEEDKELEHFDNKYEIAKSLH